MQATSQHCCGSRPPRSTAAAAGHLAAGHFASWRPGEPQTSANSWRDLSSRQPARPTLPRQPHQKGANLPERCVILTRAMVQAQAQAQAQVPVPNLRDIGTVPCCIPGGGAGGGGGGGAFARSSSAAPTRHGTRRRTNAANWGRRQHARRRPDAVGEGRRRGAEGVGLPSLRPFCLAALASEASWGAPPWRCGAGLNSEFLLRARS